MKIDHVGIAVRKLDEHIATWQKALGVAGSPPEIVESQRVRVSFPR